MRTMLRTMLWLPSCCMCCSPWPFDQSCIMWCPSFKVWNGCCAGVNIPIQDTQPGGGRKCAYEIVHFALCHALCDIRLVLQLLGLSLRFETLPLLL